MPFGFSSPACGNFAWFSPLPLAGEGRVRALLVRRFVLWFFGLSMVSVDAKTDSRPCVSCRPSWPARDFLLLVQEKVTKENTPSVPRRPQSGRFATGGRVRSTGHPGLTIESARSLAPPACGARGFSVRPSPRHRGVAAKSHSKAKAGSRPSPGRRGLVALLSRLSALPAFAFASRVPLGRGEGAKEKARRGTRRMRVRSLSGHGWPVSEPP
jgi:hypothetical protein